MINISRRTVVAGLATMALARPTMAQRSYPQRPIKLVIGFSAGGTMDAIGRVLADVLGPVLGNTIVVENRPGASGVVGFDTVMTSEPDGYTLGLVPLTTLISLRYQNREFPADGTITGIGANYTSSLILIVNPKVVPAKNFEELKAYLTQHPDSDYTSVGHGSMGHLAMASLLNKMGVQGTHIAYKGGAPAMMDVINGTLGIMAADITSAKPFIESGEVLPLAILSSEPIDGLGVPLIRQLGYPSVEAKPLGGLVGPAGIPAEIVEKLGAALKAVTEDTTYKQRIAGTGNYAYYATGEQMLEAFREGHDTWTKVIADNGISPN
jgi:tripartite-type tricarboxylate transporter receptor subunit TctC